MMTAHLGLTQIASSQANRSITQNNVNAEVDAALTDFEQILVTVTNARTLSATEWTRNMRFNVEDDGGSAPTDDITLTVPTTTARGIFIVRNGSSFPVSVTVASQTEPLPVIEVGTTAVLTSDGTDVEFVGIETGTIPLDLGSLREISSNDIPNTAASPSGGVLTSDTTPAYGRLNGATDKALRVNWVLSNVDEVQFPPVIMPPDLDDAQDLTIHLLARMDGATDTPTIDVQVFDAIGDTEMGGATAALSATLAELTVTITAANISGNPLGFLNISLVPGAHGTDEMELFGAWIEYAKKIA
jgi:hypothetical protein